MVMCTRSKLQITVRRMGPISMWKALSNIMAGDADAYFIDQSYEVLRELQVMPG